MKGKIDKHEEEVFKSRGKRKEIKLDEDYILINQSMVEHTSRPEVMSLKEKILEKVSTSH